MARERSSSGGARTGQWTQTVRQKGPVIRRYKPSQDPEEVLANVEAGCSEAHGAIPLAIRDFIMEEEWVVVRRWLEDGAHSRKRRYEALHAMAVQARVLRQACWDRQSTPVWIDSAASLLMERPDERLSVWASAIARRDLDAEINVNEEYRAAVRHGSKSDVETLAVLYHLVDSSIDDVAKLCDAPRDRVVRLVWGEEPEETTTFW